MCEKAPTFSLMAAKFGNVLTLPFTSWMLVLFFADDTRAS